jgi:polyisoprenoid-binding protein YceI
MSAIAEQPFLGTFRADPVHSSFGFAVRHSAVYRYRGTLSDVSATLRADGGLTTLEGSARVESISITDPPAFRAHVLGPEFFDAETHPEVTFRSTDVRFAEDGQVQVGGELTIKGITRPVTAAGRYDAPRPGPYGGVVGGLQLRAAVDRRDFGFGWQMEMPGGGDGLGWEVELEIELRLEGGEG